MNDFVIPFEQLGMHDVERVGGKNASLGEMIGALAKLGVKVPGGFATTAKAYREFLSQAGLDERIRAELAALNVDDIARLAASGARIRQWILTTPFPPALEQAVSEQLRRMSAGQEIAVAVRSSATAEDLPEASFAGQQETFLNVRGEQAVLKAMHEVFASLFNDRAISYRVHQGFDHSAVALSAGVQHMVRSDLGASGVMFTLDTDSGFRDVVFITASCGLGETVVQGAVNPDEFYVYKPALRAGKLAILRRNLGGKAIKMVYAPPGSAERVRTVEVPEAERRRFCLEDADLNTLARQALLIEEHYGRPMDIEWARDGETGTIYILQARPETVQSRAGRTIQRYALKGRSRVLATGRSIGQRIGAGTARVIKDASEMARVQTRRRAGRRHDRSGLGAGHEARGRDRHQSRRPHLPRRHHRPRAGHSGRGRLRRRHAEDPARARKSPFRALKATPARCTRACSSSSASRWNSTRCPRFPSRS